MAGRAGQAFGLAGSLGRRYFDPRTVRHPNRVETVVGDSSNSSRSIRKMRYPPFTQELRLGLPIQSTSSLEVRHD